MSYLDHIGNEEEVMVIDARGLACPRPVILAEDAFSKMQEGIVDILVDTGASVRNLKRFATQNGFYAESVLKDGYWLVKIVKGYPCELPEEEVTQRAAGDLLVVIASDIMGKEEDLGGILMKSFLETMKAFKELPHTIFFLNSGVKLTTIGREIIPILKDLEAMGVEIFTCRICLVHLDLESELKVGFKAEMAKLLEKMKGFEKTVWIG
jgi:selenium metabolism protein YedF